MSLVGHFFFYSLQYSFFVTDFHVWVLLSELIETFKPLQCVWNHNCQKKGYFLIAAFIVTSISCFQVQSEAPFSSLRIVFRAQRDFQL